MASTAHIPTTALVAAFGESWLELLSQASPEINFDNIIKTKKPSAPKLSPSQRNSIAFDQTKCHARVVSEVKDELGRPIYKKTGKIHPGYLDMQCSSRQADGSCFCKRHSLLGGGNGNLGKFSDPRPDIIKYPKHPDDEWLWADDPRCEEFRRSDDDKQQKKSKAPAKPKAKTKQPDIVYSEVSWTTVAQDTKMKKDLAICYLQHHNISITDPLGKTFGVGTLRGLVRKHFYDRKQDDEPTQESSPRPPSENDSDETLQNDDSQENHHNDPDEFTQQPTYQDDDDDDDGTDTDPDFSDITYQGVPYKLDSFNDVYNCGDLAHMGSWNEEKKKIIFENNEAKLLHLDNMD